MRNKKRAIHLCLLVLFAAGIFCLSAKQAYAGDALSKLGRGFANLGTGLLEIPKEIEKQNDQGGDIPAFFIGPIKGLAKGLGRMAVGLYEVLTFIIPIPKNYEPVIQPEFVYSKP